MVPILCRGKPIGWLLGLAIAPGGTIVSDEWIVPDIEQIEARLYEHGGRFACVLIASRISRVYLDPGGTLSMVYAVAEPAAGSTSTALALDDAAHLARKRAEPSPRANAFFPAGLTGDGAFARLLPNHYLDLDRWRTVRHWPAAMPVRDVMPPGDAGPAVDVRVHTILACLRDNIRAVADRFQIHMGLTAGRDSRIVLAAARDVARGVAFFTFRFKPGGYNKDKVVDVHAARRLAKRLKLTHRVVDLRDPPRAMKDQYQFRTGYCGHWGRVVDHHDALLGVATPGTVLMTGFAGEVGRCFYWGWGAALNEKLTPAVLLGRMHLPSTAENLAAMARWLDGLPGDDYFAVLDLLYIEQRVGCWAGPAMYGSAPFAFTLTPFNHRRIFAAMMSLPVDYRMTQQLADDLVRRAWPEAADHPFQQYVGVRALVAKVGNVIIRLSRRLSRRRQNEKRRGGCHPRGC